MRFSKSIRVGKHIRVNVSKRGLGASVGVKGARIGVGPRGTRVTASIPGTGISTSKTITTGKKRTPQASRHVQAPAAPMMLTPMSGALPPLLPGQIYMQKQPKKWWQFWKSEWKPLD